MQCVHVCRWVGPLQCIHTRAVCHLCFGILVGFLCLPAQFCSGLTVSQLVGLRFTTSLCCRDRGHMRSMVAVPVPQGATHLVQALHVRGFGSLRGTHGPQRSVVTFSCLRPSHPHSTPRISSLTTRFICTPSSLPGHLEHFRAADPLASRHFARNFLQSAQGVTTPTRLETEHRPSHLASSEALLTCTPEGISRAVETLFF